VRALGAQGDPLWTVPLPSEGGLSMVPSSRPKFSPDGSRAYVGTMLPGQPAGQEYSYLYAFDAGAAPILEADTATPAPFEFAARPNPFRDVADLELRLPRATHVRLEVIDLSGRRVASLFEGSLGAGTHTHGWDGLDRGGNPVGLGLYFVRADAGAATVTRKLVRAR